MGSLRRFLRGVKRDQAREKFSNGRGSPRELPRITRGRTGNGSTASDTGPLGGNVGLQPIYFRCDLRYGRTDSVGKALLLTRSESTTAMDMPPTR